jgi:alpha-L-fucosidase
MDIDEKNRILAAAYRGHEESFWFQGRFRAEPHDEAREKRIQWFREARIGLFPHWSPMAVVGRGGAAPLLEHMSPKENERICRQWHVRPDFARRWVELAIAAGAKYIIFTTNHCDGLKMWDSRVSDFNSVRVGPKRDLIAESLSAAREAGLRVGLYYSPSEPFAHQDPRYIGDDAPATDRHDFRRKACTEKPEWARRYRKRIFAEIEELLTNYGRIDIWWHDGPLPADILPPNETEALMRRLQPDMLINDRIIGGADSELPGDFATQDYNESPHHGQKIGEPGRDWETGMPINMSWSYIPESRRDTARLRDLLHVLQINVAEQGNLLLSIAPKGDGTVDDTAELVLREFGQWTRDHAEAVYGRFQRCRRITDAGKVIRYLTPGISKCAKWALKDDNTAYLWVRWWPGGDWPIGHFDHHLKKVTLVNTGQDVPFKQIGPRVELSGLPAECPDRVAHYAILKFEFQPART